TEMPGFVFESPSSGVFGVDQYKTVLFRVFVQPMLEGLIGSPGFEFFGIQDPAGDLLVAVHDVDIGAPMVPTGPWDGGIFYDFFDGSHGFQSQVFRKVYVFALPNALLVVKIPETGYHFDIVTGRKGGLFH